MTTQPTEPDSADTTPARDELTIMRRLVTTLDNLDQRTRDRIVTYIADRYDPRRTGA